MAIIGLDEFAEIITRERPSLVRAARALIGDRDEAEDAAHDALVAAWRGLPGLRDRSRFGPWLSRILTRTALRRRARLLSRPAVGDLSRVPAPVTHPDPRLDRLIREVSRMPEKYRVLVTLHYLRGHSYREVAAAADLPEKRVKSRLFEARRLLQKRMGDGDERREPAPGTAGGRGTRSAG
jgi:RNA polymerase sigma-70 factor (ECF subfamily)